MTYYLPYSLRQKNYFVYIMKFIASMSTSTDTYPWKDGVNEVMLEIKQKTMFIVIFLKCTDKCT